MVVNYRKNLNRRAAKSVENRWKLMGQLERIWIKRFHGGPMDPVETAELRCGAGIVGSADQGGWRQVTIMAAREWDQVVETLATPVDPAIRRANLLISGVELARSHDQVLRVGHCRLRIRGETRPCKLMDEVEPGLRTALASEWRGGVFAEVLDDGTITIGDPADWCKN